MYCLLCFKSNKLNLDKTQVSISAKYRKWCLNSLIMVDCSRFKLNEEFVVMLKDLRVNILICSSLNLFCKQ